VASGSLSAAVSLTALAPSRSGSPNPVGGGCGCHGGGGGSQPNSPSAPAHGEQCVLSRVKGRRSQEPLNDEPTA
jgi:hypothetical protein